MTNHESREAGPAPNGGNDAAADDAAQLRAKLDEALASARRWQAEFVNYQMRVARERESDRKFATEALLRELLPLADTARHTVAQLTKSGAPPACIEAATLLEKELVRVLAKHGVTPIPTASASFDPTLHDAVAVVDSAQHEDDAVVDELRPGYLIHGRVLRPAQVRIARKVSGRDEPKA